MQSKESDAIRSKLNKTDGESIIFNSQFASECIFACTVFCFSLIQVTVYATNQKVSKINPIPFLINKDVWSQRHKNTRFGGHDNNIDIDHQV